jgi:hypothetical protein
MTIDQVEQAARERYNAVGEPFWSQSEMWNLMYGACLELAVETLCIERTYSTTTVAATQEYAFPTNVIMVKRVTYDGSKIEPISQRQGDALTLNQNAVTISGAPQWYAQFNETFTLYPTPDDAKTLKVWGIVEPQAITTATATLEVPSFCHMRLLNYMLAEMYAKDKDFNSAGYYKGLWEKDKIQVKAWMRKMRRGDSPAQVINEERMPTTILGLV